MDKHDFMRVTEQWLRDVVVSLNLCPFAAQPFKLGRIRYLVCEEQESDAIFRALLLEMETMLDLPEAEAETSLFILPYGLATFDAYLALLDTAEAAVQAVGLEGILQLASFHPDYRFDGANQDDPANYTNRSPYPMFHLIREASLEQALASYPNPELIPQRNVVKLRSLGLMEMQRRLRLCKK